ncbi:MAG: UDP-N-acetylglucosamine 2-epimerase (hydrolyzing) [Muribaculaceae bacterium]|nr:UDP-N-acetylglucosamine 2-epimerase (hydrolyzing) [Muribaculaceae bacterium]
MRKICFITGTRADYGIMAPLMRMIADSEEAILQIIATNMHLSPEYGMTVKEIEADGFKVDRRIESLLSADTASATVKSMGLTQIGLADALDQLRPDIAVILGDRYEMLAAASAALIFRIPVAHLHGGETTEGAYDDCIRHAITKLSYLHFTSTELYAQRVVRMGESPERVFWVGAPGAENIRNEKLIPLEEVEESIGFRLGERYMVATYHPVTTRPGEEEAQTKAFLNALSTKVKEGWRVLFTLPNSDTGGRKVAELIKAWAEENKENVKAVASLGRRRYYSVLAHSAAAVGNSSSGLIEAPSFGVPTLNVGDRQKGRAQGDSVVNCSASQKEIEQGLEIVLSPQMRAKAKNCINPYEKPGSVEAIAETLLHFPLNGQKTFYEDD